jgi:hypothetical protein
VHERVEQHVEQCGNEEHLEGGLEVPGEEPDGHHAHGG